MPSTRARKRFLLLAGLVALVGLLVACGGGVSQKDLDDAKARAAVAEAKVVEKESEVSQLQAEIKGLAPVTMVQAGQLQPVPAAAQPTGWDTAESIRAGLKLVATYDSSGPDAWSAKDHPLIYISSEGTLSISPKYDKSAPFFAGFHLIDANTKEVVKSALFNVGQEIIRYPHGVMVSPDGKWAYVGWGQKDAAGKDESVVAIVNMRTLKIDKLLKQESYYQGKMRRQYLHHIQSFKDSKGQDRVVLTFGFGSDGGPHVILDPKDDNRVVKAITYDDVKPMGHPFTTPSPDGKFLYISMDSPEITRSEFPAAGIAKLNLETGAVTVIPNVGHHPIGITHTADGKFTYVNDAETSQTVKIDNTTNTVVARTSAGVAGPYGLALNWDETRLYVIGKGEGSHNKGGVVGVIDTNLFRQDRTFTQLPITLGGSASSIDHGILHPDPAVNELWISDQNGWETIVLDLNTNKTKAYIPTPNGGDTHSGGFVRYNADWTGEVLLDQGGPKSESIWAIVRAKVAELAAAKK
ncbi:MAG: YncE family protein [Chloroflexi bacterium]|nr:YncE family protein [Chloroflexota bacterium]